MKKSNLILSFLLTLIAVFALASCGSSTTTELVCGSGYELNEAGDQCVAVTESPVEFSVSLNSQSKTITQGESFILVVTLDGITDYDSIGWASENNLLTIAPDGSNAVISSGTDTGTDTITVTVTKGDVSETAECEVTVNAVTLSLSVDAETITLNQGESRNVVVTVNPERDETVLSWDEDGDLLGIVADGNTATITAGADTGTTTVVITATIFDTPFTKEVTVIVNAVEPVVDIEQSSADVNVGEDVDINLDFTTAYQSDKTWNVSFSDDTFASAVVTEDDVLRITGLAEGQTTLTLTMTTNSVEYTDTITVNVRPMGYVSISDNVYDPFDLQLNFTESTYFSSIDESIWQEYNILLGGASNQDDGDLRGQFIFKINTVFAKDGDKDVIQVMANGMSAIAVKIPDTITDLGAVDFSMKMCALDPESTQSWRMEFFVATVKDDKTLLYARSTDDNSALSLGTLTLTPEELHRDGYQTYRFNVDAIPENAGNWIVIYLGNTASFNGTEEDRTYIDGFNFIEKEYTGIELTTPPTDLEYVVGQAFDPTDMVVSALYTSGNVIPIAHEDLTFDYDFTTTGTKTVTVNYGDDSVTVEVTVIEKAVVSLEVTTDPDKIIYTEGESFDPTGMVVTAVYNDDSTEVVDTYTYDDSPLTAGTQSITLSYSGQMVDVAITVNAAVLTGISVTSSPTMTEYVVGQDINYDGLVVTASYDDSSTEEVSFADLVITGFDSSAVATDQVITVAYGDHTATFTVNIIAREMVDITIESYPRVVYLVGESSDWNGLTVAGVYNDNTTEAINFGDLTITGFDSSAVANLTATVTYQTYTATLPITITDAQGYVEALTSTMNFPAAENSLVPNDTMYTDLFYGDSPVDSSTFDLLLGRTLNDGERMLQYSEAIYLNDDNVIVISANGMSAFGVRIPDGLTAADITAFTISLSGEGLDSIITDPNEKWRPTFRFSSIYDGVEYFHTTDRGSYYLPESGRMTIMQPDFTRTGYNDYTVMMTQPTPGAGVTLGNYILIYCGNDGTFRDSDGTALKINGFKFWTRDAVVDIALNSEPTKTEYVVGETLDTSGLEVVPLLGIDLYEPMTSISTNDLTFDYDFSTAGTKTVTVNYGSQSVTFDVNVVDRVITDLAVTTPPDKTEYSVGDTFDDTGMVVTASYNDGSQEVVTGYTYSMDPLALEDTAVTISFDGLSTDVAITVQEKVITSIAITTPPTKTEYVVGQTADYDGLVVTATYEDTTTAELPFEDLTITGFDSSAVATGQVITVTVGSKTATFTIDVIARVAESIEVAMYPQINYYVGDSADWSGLAVNELFNDDTAEAIATGDLTITGFDSSVAGDVTITVAYDSFSTTFEIRVHEVQTSTDYVEVFTQDMNFPTDDLVNKSTMYNELFSGDNPVDSALFDVLLGRTLNDAERMIQYSDAIIFEGEGINRVIQISANGMSAFAVRIPDGLTAADIKAFTITLSGEGLDSIITDPNEKWSPSFRFSSVYDGVEYFHTMDRGTYYLEQSGSISIMQPDFTRAGYYDYTVVIDQPTLAAGVTIGNYIIVYCGNDGTFRASDGTALRIDGFKFWTADVISSIAVDTNPTKTTYTVGETFDPTGMVVTPTYAVDAYEQMSEINLADLTFDYDFSTAGTKTVTINYGDLSVTIDVTVQDPV